MAKKRIAILTGGGSRVPHLLEHFRNQQMTEIILVVSHKKESPGLERAKEEGIPTARFLIKGDYENKGKTRTDLEDDLVKLLKEYTPDLIVMTGWMLVLSDEFLTHFPMKVINVHPALCPAFPGAHGIEDALAYGVKVTGATVHFVPDSGVDSGPIILQQAVAVTEDETVETLRSKIQSVEDEILPRAIEIVLARQLRFDGRTVRVAQNVRTLSE